MTLKWIGAIFVITGCSGWGIMLARAYRRQEILLERLGRLLQMMRWELSYRLTPLPDLCKEAASTTTGILRTLFLSLTKEMENHSQPDVGGCMETVLHQLDHLPPKIKRILRHLGKILGRYDLEGQLQGMDTVIRECERELKSLAIDRKACTKNYRTLGVCAGLALVILFI